MADISYIKSLFGSTPDTVKKAAEQAFTYVLSNYKIGPFVPMDEMARRAINFQWYWLSGTTPAVAQTEFSVAHGLAKVPNLIIPVLPLDQVGSQLVPLTVSRAADAQRVYLKSSSTSAAFSVMVE